jgi:hypothetical protein
MNRSNPLRNALLLSLLVAAGVPAASQAADPFDASTRASAASVLAPSVAGGVLIAGSLSALQLSGQAVVASVETVAEGTVLVLRGASEVGTVSVRIVGGASVAAGSVVRVVAMSTGCALIAAGRMIAFIPNEVGTALVHQSRVTAQRNAYIGDR